MEREVQMSGFLSGGWRGFSGKRGVLLREPEKCAECNRIFISLYPLKHCGEHEGLDEV